VKYYFTIEISAHILNIKQFMWVFTVMPLESCNFTATFERLTDSVLRGLTYDVCIVYFDASLSLVAHSNLRKVFQMLRESNLKFNPEKC
jgi:hypothetical protein